MRLSKAPQNGQPFWQKPQTIHHVLDKDIVASMSRGKEKCSVLMMMDPHFEHQTNRYHIEWSSDDVGMLLNGMLIRSLEILRNAKPTNPLFKEEILWQSTPQFAEVCRFAGFDPRIIREEVKNIMKRYGKSIEVDQLAEFVHWCNFFADMFKKEVAVKVIKQNLVKALSHHCNGRYELTIILKQICELMDDLYISNVTSRDVMEEFLAQAINS